jgi:hypothetical protein
MDDFGFGIVRGGTVTKVVVLILKMLMIIFLLVWLFALEVERPRLSRRLQSRLTSGGSD